MGTGELKAPHRQSSVMSYEAKPTLDMLDALRNLQHLKEQAAQIPRKETSDPPKHAAAPLGTGEELALIVDDIFRQPEDLATGAVASSARRASRGKDNAKDSKPEKDAR